MLDILSNYVALRNYPSERIDGGVTGRHRQNAIDRYINIHISSINTYKIYKSIYIKLIYRYCYILGLVIKKMTCLLCY